MGAVVNLTVGDAVGADVGAFVEMTVGAEVLTDVGACVALVVGGIVGDEVGEGADVGAFVEMTVGAEVLNDVGTCVALVVGGTVGDEVGEDVVVTPVIGISRTKTSPASTVTVTAPLLIEGELEPDALQTLTELKVKSFGVMVTLARLLESITSAFAGSFVTPLLLIKVTTQEFESLFN